MSTHVSSEFTGNPSRSASPNTERIPLPAGTKSASIPIAKNSSSEMELAKMREAQIRDFQFYNRMINGAKASTPKSCLEGNFLPSGGLVSSRLVELQLQDDGFVLPEGEPSFDLHSSEPEEDETMFEMDL